MRSECIAAVAQVLGKAPSESQVRTIEEQLNAAMRAEARRDVAAWQAMSPADRVRAGAARAAQDLAGTQALKQRRALLQTVATARVRKLLSEFPGTPMEALARLVAFHADTRGSMMSIETRARAIERDSLRQMIGTIEATAPKFFGLIEQTEGIRDVVKELHGEDSGNADAKKAAQAFKDVSEQLRQRFNRAGGDMGKLDDWGLPHHHSQHRVAMAGKTQWVNDTLPLLNRARYLDELGRPLPEAELRRFLEEAWTSIATGGANKMEPGRFSGVGMRANRGSETRQIHYKSADDYLQYQEKYGEAPAYDVMIGHIGAIAKDVALVETLGPNPDHTFRLLRDEALQAQTLAEPKQAGKLLERAHNLDNLYGLVSGKSIPVANSRVAVFFDTLRNLMVASKLGSAVITAVTDEGTMRVAARVNNLSQVQLARNELAALNPANQVEKRMALRAGLAMNTLAHSLNRFANESMVAGWSAKMAQATLRASGLNAMTDARRRAWGVTQMGAVGGVVKDHASLADIDPIDHRILKSKGVTDTDFAVWKAAQLEDWGGGNDTMLTPDAIYRVPDVEVARIIAPEAAEVRAGLDAEIAELDARNQQEQGWLAKRRDRFDKAQQDAAAAIEELRAKQDDRNTAAADYLTLQMEALQARMGEVTAARDAGDISARARGRAEGRALSRAADLERRLAEFERRGDQRINERAEQIGRRMSALRKELTEFADRSQQRQQRRQAVMDRMDASMPKRVRDLIAQAKENAATRLMGLVLEETDIAVIEPGARERALMMAHLQRGSLKGELTRSFFLFKSFPLAMITRHWARALSAPTAGGKAAYLAALTASTTVLGMLALQAAQIAQGKDPRSMVEWKSWVQALLKGGALSLFGDFVLADQTEGGQSALASFAGPVAGLAEETLALTVGNAHQLARGEDTHAGAEAVKLLKGNMPGANLWYTRAAIDHLVFHSLQEYLSPGYLRKMERRARKEYDQRFWWEPGETAPERAPDFQRAVEPVD